MSVGAPWASRRCSSSNPLEISLARNLRGSTRERRAYDPVGFHCPGRPAQRRQVDAGQRDRRRQGGDRVRQAPDDAAGACAEWPPAPTGSSCSSTCPASSGPRDALTERMQRRVEHELADADGCLFVLNAQEGLGPGTGSSPRLLKSAPVPVVIAVNKVDRANRAALAVHPAGRGRARAGRRDLPGERAPRGGHAGARRAPGHAAARGPVLLPARAALGPV